MKVDVVLEIVPFKVPKEIWTIQEGRAKPRSIKYHELDKETIKDLCILFTKDVMEEFHKQKSKM